MKKLLAIILSVAMLLSMAACGETAKETKGDELGTVTEEVKPEETKEKTEKINWFDIDEATTYLFSRIPII